jgi:hypothetical protein
MKMIFIFIALFHFEYSFAKQETQPSLIKNVKTESKTLPDLYIGVQRGPHGGITKKSDVFFVEAKFTRSGLFIYLLNENLENPMTESSKVEISYNTADGRILKTCKLNQKEDLYFTCPGPDADVKPESVSVHAVRDMMKGKEAKFPWPLSLKSPTRNNS